MDIYDKNIIGYDSVKRTLREIGDVLKHTEKYKDKGAVLPKGLLLVGSPGIGKSSLAACLIADSDRETFKIRKDSENEGFLEEIRKVFELAKDKPAIILMEDLDKFSASNSAYASEWATIQSLIDESGESTFILATANDTRYIASSLLRTGRFDYVIKMEPPKGEIAVKIMTKYLQDYKLADDILISDIAKAMPDKSCSDLESVVNVAKMYSIYDDEDCIHREHFIRAILEIVYNRYSYRDNQDIKEMESTAYHEAAHCMVSEVLSPGLVSLVTICPDGDSLPGMTVYDDSEINNRNAYINRIMVGLAGRACSDVIYNEDVDFGSHKDIQTVLGYLYSYITGYGGSGLSNIEYDDRGFSEEWLSRSQALVAGQLEEFYHRTKDIIKNNRDLLERIKDALLEKETLLASDIEKLKTP